MKAFAISVVCVVHVLVAVLALMALAPPAVSAAGNVAEILKQLADAHLGGRLSVDLAEGLFGGNCKNRREGDYWVMDCNDPAVGLVLRGKETSDVSDEAELRFDLNAGLVLRDLERFLGPWKPVFSSKTSSVSFPAAGKAGRPSVIFAHLSTANPTPTSPVLSVRFR